MIRSAIRWSAALAFATSLAFTARTLLVVWPAIKTPPSPTARTAATHAVLDVLLWTAFAAHHSLLARPRVKRRLAAHLDADGQRSCYVWVASVLLAATMAAWQPVGHVIYAAPAWMRVALLAVQAAGVLLAVQAARIVDPLELAGLRPARGVVEARGPYRWVRHPIYLGVLLILWAPSVLTGDRLLFAALATLYVLVAMPWEEASLRQTLGEGYDAYCARVRWRILPGLH